MSTSFTIRAALQHYIRKSRIIDDRRTENEFFVHRDDRRAASRLIFATDNWFTRPLHNQAALAVQRCLHLEGLQMILPMKVSAASAWFAGCSTCPKPALL